MMYTKVRAGDYVVDVSEGPDGKARVGIAKYEEWAGGDVSLYRHYLVADLADSSTDLVTLDAPMDGGPHRTTSGTMKLEKHHLTALAQLFEGPVSEPCAKNSKPLDALVAKGMATRGDGGGAPRWEITEAGRLAFAEYVAAPTPPVHPSGRSRHCVTHVAHVAHPLPVGHVQVQQGVDWVREPPTSPGTYLCSDAEGAAAGYFLLTYDGEDWSTTFSVGKCLPPNSWLFWAGSAISPGQLGAVDDLRKVVADVLLTAEVGSARDLVGDLERLERTLDALARVLPMEGSND